MNDLFPGDGIAGSEEYRRQQLATTTFHGDDYVPSRDKPRLTGQLGRVYSVMRDGHWRSVEELAADIERIADHHDPAQSVARQIRYLRCHGIVERRHEGGGLYRYRFHHE